LRALNSIDIAPTNLQALGSEKWKSKDTSEVKDFTVLEKTVDWAFSSPYKGTIQPLTTAMQTLTQWLELPQELVWNL